MAEPASFGAGQEGGRRRDKCLGVNVELDVAGSDSLSDCTTCSADDMERLEEQPASAQGLAPQEGIQRLRDQRQQLDRRQLTALHAQLEHMWM